MQTVTLDDRGRIVLPREVAEDLGVGRGDTVVFEKRGKEFLSGKRRGSL